MHFRRGFTLIELLVVIAIIGILATLVITLLGAAQVRGRNASARNLITQMSKGAELFKSDTNNTTLGVVDAVLAAGSGANNPGVDTFSGTCNAPVYGTPAQTICAIFTGVLTPTGNSMSYGTKLNATQIPAGSSYLITYGSNSTLASGAAATAIATNVAGTGVGGYVIGTNLVVVSGSAAAFWITSGTSTEGAAVPVAGPF